LVPLPEMFEKEDKFIVKAELLGVKREKIDVSVSGDTMTIKGERKTETGINKEDYHFCERFYGSFFRSITLPSAVNTEKTRPAIRMACKRSPCLKLRRSSRRRWRFPSNDYL